MIEMNHRQTKIRQKYRKLKIFNKNHIFTSILRLWTKLIVHHAHCSKELIRNKEISHTNRENSQK